MGTYLNKTGLQKAFTKLKAKIDAKLDATRDGTYKAINLLGIGTATPVDADYTITQSVGGGTTNTEYVRRPMSSIWNYIKGKADSVYQPKGDYVPLRYAVLSTSSNTYKGKYTKFATIDLSKQAAYTPCSMTLEFLASEGTCAIGTLYCYIRNSDVAGAVGTATVYWKSLSNSSFAGAVSLVKDSAGVCSLYYKPNNDWDTTMVQMVASRNPAFVTLYSNQAYVDSVTAYMTSAVYSVAKWADITGRPSFATVATSGSYNDLSNKPTIPSVGNGTITITQNGTSKGTFTMNQSGNTTIELTDNDSWRGIQNNLTSTSTTDSLSAAQGKALNDKFASYVPTTRTVNGKALSGNITLAAGDVGAATSSHTHAAMTAATATAAGAAGFVPAPAAGKQTSFLRGDGQWVVPTNTTYTANNGVSLSGTTFSNSGVRSVSTGSSNGTISVNTGGSSANVAVKGLGSAAYTASTAYSAADLITVSSTQPTSSTCKMWVKV